MKAGKWLDRWQGRTVICIASGPSLTAEDCETAHASGHPVVVTNNTFKLCPWADALVAFDGKWWKEYVKEVDAVFKGERLTCSTMGKSLGAVSLKDEPWFRNFHNSGATAISLAIAAGSKRVLLLGFDCQRTGGKTHWHGDHPPTLGNARSMGNWPLHFKGVSRYAAERKVEVVNCSRETALKCFPRATFAEALELESACCG